MTEQEKNPGIRELIARFDLVKPTDKSPECYRRFYYLFYLITLTDKVMYSYILEGADRNRRDVSEDIALFLLEVIDDIPKQYNGISYLLQCQGVFCNRISNEFLPNIPNDALLQDILNHVSNVSDYEGIFKGMLNVREFQMLYSSIETAVKSLENWKGIEKQSKGENFLIVAKNNNLLKLDSYTEAAWRFYQKVRNLYAHQYGFITSENQITELFSDRYKNFISEFDREFCLSESERLINGNMFIRDEFKINSLYLLNDTETLIFRDIAIDIMESINQTYINQQQA